MTLKDFERKEFVGDSIDAKLGVFEDKVDTRIASFENQFRLAEISREIDPKEFLAICNRFLFPDKIDSI